MTHEKLLEKRLLLDKEIENLITERNKISKLIEQRKPKALMKLTSLLKDIEDTISTFGENNKGSNVYLSYIIHNKARIEEKIKSLK